MTFEVADELPITTWFEAVTCAPLPIAVESVILSIEDLEVPIPNEVPTVPVPLMRKSADCETEF